MRWLLLLGFLWPLYLFGQLDPRADSLGISETEIWLDATQKSSKILHARVKINLQIKKGPMSQIHLDLEKLTVDSIFENGRAISFYHTSPRLILLPDSAYSQGSVHEIDIYYHGTPGTDPQGFGGFIFNEPYAYNLGVGFTVNPHNYGRSWFPCLDNFVTRTLYKIHVKSKLPDIGVASGLLLGKDTLGNFLSTHWAMQRDIPSYLLGVAIAPYIFIQDTFAPKIPVILAVLSDDSLRASTSFQNLRKVYDGFVRSFGPYPFERVGFMVVPFGGGAMEHASSITYPLFGVSGTLDYETLYSHELSHMWWGNNVTCREANEMWLNEGWASYSEAVAMEILYGKQGYRSEISSNHTRVLWDAHIVDSGYKAVQGVSHRFTYGKTVYNKGADIARTLRGYMDSADFNEACRSYHQKYFGKDVNSEDLRKHFEFYFHGGSLQPFFKHWVYAPGFPHFSVEGPIWDGIQWKATLRQNKVGAPELFDSVPLEIRFFGENDSTGILKKWMISGYETSLEVTLPDKPVFYLLDPDDKLADAISQDEFQFFTGDTGLKTGTNSLCNLQSQGGITAKKMYIDHHWFKPSGTCSDPNIFLSPDRYWTVTGDFDSIPLKAIFKYNGTKARLSGNLDSYLIPGAEDSLCLLYRAPGSSIWHKVSDAQWNKGLRFDKKGYFEISNFKKGDYAFGNKDQRLITPPIDASPKYTLYPNPAKEILFIKSTTAEPFVAYLISADGKLIDEWSCMGNKECVLNLSSKLSSGLYYISMMTQGTPISVETQQIFIP